MIAHKKWSITVTRKRGAPPTEWSQRDPAERAAIIAAPFPSVIRRPGYLWAGTIAVLDETDDIILQREGGPLFRNDNSHYDGVLDNIVRTMEGD